MRGFLSDAARRLKSSAEASRDVASGDEEDMLENSTGDDFSLSATAVAATDEDECTAAVSVVMAKIAPQLCLAVADLLWRFYKSVKPLNCKI